MPNELRGGMTSLSQAPADMAILFFLLQVRLFILDRFKTGKKDKAFDEFQFEKIENFRFFA